MKDLGSLLWALRPWDFWNAFVLIVGIGITWWFYHRDNKHYSVTKSHSRQLLNSIPTIWTSLGIFGTFCAICISLNHFSVGEGEQNMSLITSLISKLVPAFSTSIYGIIGAVITTLINKTRYQTEELLEFEQIDSPENNIKALVELAREQQEQSRQYNEQLTKNILAQSEILQTFVNDFVAKMDVIFKKMESSIEQQVKAFGESQFEQSRQVIENMTKKMSEVSSGLLEQQNSNIKASMDATQQQLGEISSSLASMIENITSSSSSAVQALSDQQRESLTLMVQNQEALSTKLFEVSSDLLEQQRDNIKFSIDSTQQQLGEISSSLASMIENITSSSSSAVQTLSDQQRESLTQLLQSQEALSSRLYEESAKTSEQMQAKMEKLGEQYAASNEEMLRIATEQNERVAEQLNESLSSVVAQISEAVKSECNCLTESITSVVTQLKVGYEFIDEHIAQIKSDYEQATLAYRDAVQNAHDNNETIENAIVRMDESLAAVEATNKSIKDILVLLETRQTNIDNLTQRIREIGEAIVTLQNLESTLNKLRG